MKINNDILNLIVKELQGKISEAEQIQLAQWRGANEDHQHEYQKIAEIWKAGENLNVNIDVDQEWNIFRSKHFNSQSGGKLIKLNYRMTSRIAAAAVLIIGAFLLGRFILGGQNYSTHSGERLLVNLEDGTRVILGENSQLEVTSKFNTATRTLTLNGEAFFDVAHNPEKPFVINGEKTSTKVLGTSFHIENTSITVSDGRVAFWQNSLSDTLILTPGEEGLLVQKKLVERKISNLNYDSWQTGNFVFENQPISEVLESLQDHYIFNIANLEKLQNANCRFSGKFENQSLEDVLDELALVMGLQYKWTQNTLSVKAFNCK